MLSFPRVLSLALAVASLSMAVDTATAAEGRLYEMRTYWAPPGKLDALHARFRDHTTKIWARMGWNMVGFWTYKFGGRSDQLVYMLAWPDMATRDAQFAAFQADPEWVKARTAS